MKRAIIFSSATVAGLAGVFGFHTAPVSLTLSSLGSSAGAAAPAVGAGVTSTTTRASTTSTTTAPPPPSTSTTSAHRSAKATSGTTTPTRAPSTTTTVARTTTTVARTSTTVSSAARSAAGEAVNYYFGILSVSVTVTGSKIDSVKIAQINDGGNFRSQQIDQMSIPILEQETVRAQSANIQSVSGASYTSAGFVMSLQSALKKLGI